MDIEKYTERARGFIQAAQSLAMREGHQQFSSLHVLKVLLDDSEGLAAGLIDRAGGNSRAILKATEDALNKLPKVSGSGAGQLCHRGTAAARPDARKRRRGRYDPEQGRRHRAESECGDRSLAQGPHRGFG